MRRWPDKINALLQCSLSSSQRDAGGSRAHFDRTTLRAVPAAGCRAVWLQRQYARSEERAVFHCLSLKVVIAIDAIKSSLN